MAGQRRDRVSEIVQRRYWRESEGREIVTAWQESGKPLARFAREYGLKYRRMTRWAARLRVRSSDAVQFHPVRLVPGVGSTGERAVIEVVLVDGRRIRVPEGFSAEELRRVLLVLETQASC